jgi:hypothetical protein
MQINPGSYDGSGSIRLYFIFPTLILSIKGEEILVSFLSSTVKSLKSLNSFIELTLFNMSLIDRTIYKESCT